MGVLVHWIFPNIFTCLWSLPYPPPLLAAVIGVLVYPMKSNEFQAYLFFGHNLDDFLAVFLRKMCVASYSFEFLFIICIIILFIIIKPLTWFCEKELALGQAVWALPRFYGLFFYIGIYTIQYSAWWILYLQNYDQHQVKELEFCLQKAPSCPVPVKSTLNCFSICFWFCFHCNNT